MGSFDITRYFFLKGFLIVYCIAFINVLHQYRALVGNNGLLPIQNFLKRVRFKDAPSFLWYFPKDQAIKIGGWIGLSISLLLLFGVFDTAGFFIYSLAWAILWVLYLSFVHGGQVFYGFGWETLVLEMGFLAIFIAPPTMHASWMIPWLYRWILFRLMFGAGLIKIRGDKCWRDLTCMYYYYETQPMPNPLSWYFHKLPKIYHKIEVFGTHIVELIIPFGFFLPQPIAAVCGGITFLFQLLIFAGGNLSWLNFLSMVLCICCFDDSYFSWATSFVPEAKNTDAVYQVLVSFLLLFILYRSVDPVGNLCSKRQIMNTSFDSLHFVNTYGAFGAVTKYRTEIIIKGTNDNPRNPEALWKEYSFIGKPGLVQKMPPIIAPYHLRLDWLMWFAAMGHPTYHPWFIHLMAKVLRGDKGILQLMQNNPFKEDPPKYLKADLYHYTFTEDGKNKDWWQRQFLREYYPAVSLDSVEFQQVLLIHGWK